MENAAQGGATKDEQERLLEEHNKNLEKLVNKMDADKLRMESHLQVRYSSHCIGACYFICKMHSR